MKYLLLIYMNPAIWDSRSEGERNAVYRGHGELIEAITESGELVGAEALADPRNSATVRVRDGIPAITDGPYLEAKEFLAGYYLVDCESRERAIGLATQIPDAGFNAVEVRSLMNQGGTEI